MSDAVAPATRMPGLEIPVCLRCAAENVPASTFCVACGGPLSIIATAGPFETALMQARAIGEVAGVRRPSFVVVAGVWLFALSSWAVVVAMTWRATPDAVTLGAMLVETGVVVFLVGRVTSRWARSRRDRGSGSPA